MSLHSRCATATYTVAAALFLLAGCSGGGGGSTNSPSSGTLPVVTGEQPMSPASTVQSEANAVNNAIPVDTTSMLRVLDDELPIGSTNVGGEQNPYGLDVAKSTSGKLTAGDLVVCDFNNSANVQGTGSTLLALHPVTGSKPRLLLKSPALLGCDAIALSPFDETWAADFGANDNALVSSSGHLDIVLNGHPFAHPFGEAFAGFDGANGVAAFYVSNAGDGTLIRINITKSGNFTFDTIVHGFAINGGAPGSILGPSGLQYDAKNDRLFVVDGTNNTVDVINHPSSVRKSGIFVSADGKHFAGADGALAKNVFAGPPLNGPISSALLPNGNLVIGNTLDPNGKNIMVEITHTGRLLATRNVDTGAAGSLFGIVATGHTDADTRIFFNDDNENFLLVLQH